MSRKHTSQPSPPHIRPSLLGLYEHCQLAPALVAIRQSTEQPTDSGGAMARGTRFHHAVAGHLIAAAAGLSSTTVNVDDDIADAYASWERHVFPPLEQAMRQPGVESHIEELLTTPEISGTPDFVLLNTNTGAASLWDWKTGQSSYVTELEHNRQQQAYGWLVRLHYRATAIKYHIYFADSCELESWEPSRAEQAQLDLTIRHLIEDATRSTVDSPATLGTHCSGCPARYACPAQIQALQAAVESYPGLQLEGGFRDEERALRAAYMLPRLKEAAERGREMLGRWVEEHGPLPDPATGKHYALTTRAGMERLADPAKVAAHLQILGVPPTALLQHVHLKRDAFIDLLTTDTSGPGLSVDVATQAWEELRVLGAVTSLPVTQLRWVRPRTENAE